MGYLTKDWRVKGGWSVNEKRDNLVIELLTESPRRANQLWELAKNYRLFNSKKNLYDALERLQTEGTVKKEEISHKNVLYLLSEDDEMLKRIRKGVVEMEKMIPDLLKEIFDSDEPRKVTYATFNAIILRFLITYLQGVEGTVRAPENLRSYARWLLARNTNYFQTILVALGKKDSEATDYCLWRITDILKSGILNSKM